MDEQDYLNQISVTSQVCVMKDINNNPNVVDLTTESDSNLVDTPTLNRKRKANAIDVRSFVWVVIHQLEAQYHGVGDFSHNRGCLSHVPKSFDASVLGIYCTREGANHCAREFCLELGLDDDDDDDESVDSDNNGKYVKDYVGEGVFIDGRDSGDTNTFSQRVFVKEMLLQ